MADQQECANLVEEDLTIAFERYDGIQIVGITTDPVADGAEVSDDDQPETDPNGWVRIGLSAMTPVRTEGNQGVVRWKVSLNVTGPEFGVPLEGASPVDLVGVTIVDLADDSNPLLERYTDWLSFYVQLGYGISARRAGDYIPDSGARFPTPATNS